MFNKKQLKDFAKLVLRYGVNIQKGQGLEIACPVDCKETARALAEQAYLMGAKIVRVRWNDEILEKINYDYASTNALCEIPKWWVDSKEDLVKNNFCYVAIANENPTLFKDVSPKKLGAVSKVKSKLLKNFSNSVMSDKIRWCVVSVPTKDWAKEIMPNDKNALKKLTQAIATTMRLDKPNPSLEWEKHLRLLETRAEFLNNMNFEYLHYENSCGTDLNVGLCDDHIWLSAKEIAQDGVDFVANMPTEEIFTAPHRLRVNGRVKSSLPLLYNGQIIDKFTLEFKDGKVVNYTAEKGYDTLRELIQTDEGSAYLGEVAIIGKNSPIAKTGILFYNTLFDENASCHLALGKAYPTNVKNGANLTESEQKALGLNDSIEHVDFMIGTSDLKITGITHNGEKIIIFNDGEWTI